MQTVVTGNAEGNPTQNICSDGIPLDPGDTTERVAFRAGRFGRRRSAEPTLRRELKHLVEGLQDL